MVAEGTVRAGEQSRFHHLLQPLRDLAVNWNVDIASELEEYLAEIEKIAFSFDGGLTTLNFAEAALLIQGSACIYSRKVEYLHTLVHQTLELLSAKGRKGDKHGIEAQRTDDADADAYFTADSEELLTLDDIRESENIDLADEGFVDGDGGRMRSSQHTVPRAPLALLSTPSRDDAASDQSRGAAAAHPSAEALVGPTGEVLGRRGDFRMNTALVHESGALLLDVSGLRDAPAVDRHMSACSSDTVKNTLNSAPLQLHADHTGMAPDVSEGMHDAGDDWGDVGDWGGDAGDENAKENVAPAQSAHDDARPRKSRAAVKDDPWAPLDPHDDTHSDARPFKRGNTSKAPKSVRVPLSSHGQLGTAPSTSWLRGVSRPELAPLYVEEQSRRNKMSIGAGVGRKRAVSDHFFDEFADGDDGADADDDGAGSTGPTDAPWDIGGGCDWDAPDAHAHVDGADGGSAVHDGPPSLALDAHSLSYEELVRLRVEAYLTEAQLHAQQTKLAQRVHAWEERIRPALDAEELRPAFDINAASIHLLETFTPDDTAKAEPKPFADIVLDKPRFEVCRAFVSCLQLANLGNISIVADAEQQSMSIRVLSLQVDNRIEGYRAPSLAT